KAGDRIVFHKEGTVSFCRQTDFLICRQTDFLSISLCVSSDDDKFFIGNSITKNKKLCSQIADLIAVSNGLTCCRVDDRVDHFTCEMM
ncbi:MAG: hypothetical protein QGG63_01690, partial [Candidatus Pacebacteria bacterium]|nr:hypothetical protein [Candidatus Paceibacterota bacterium]